MRGEQQVNTAEFGNNKAETILLLHGGGLSWWNYREEAKLLQDEFHVVLPVLDGHAGSDRAFSSIEDNAAEIISYIDEKLGGSVQLIGGLSLGGQILLEMLAQRKDICRCAMVESAAVIPSGLTNALIGPAFGSSYGLIKNRSFAKMQFRSLHMRQELFEDYYRDTCRIEKTDMIAFLKASTAYSLKGAVSQTQARVHVFAGEKESGTVLRSAEAICKAVPGSTKTLLPGLRHGEFSLNRPQDYVWTLREFTREE
ncbi:MAG: alpha/beta hydrolase [Oscillospiraceae bacterium]|nr:alpha/beta hydrolase [Oscillospiraceae bacterium]